MFIKGIYIFVDTVANVAQSTVDTAQKTAYSAFETGKSYAASAKGTFSIF